MVTEADRPLFRSEALESIQRRRFLSEASVQQPLKVRVFAALVTSIALAAAAFLAVAEYPRRVAARGYLTAEGALSYVHARKAGLIARTMVTEGSVVAANDPLVELTFPSELGDGADLNDVVAEELAFRIRELERQRSEQVHQYGRLEGALKAALAKREEERSELDASLRLQKRQFDIAIDQYRSMEEAFKKGAISRASMLDRRSEMIELQVGLSNRRQQHSSLEAAIVDHRRQIEQLRLEKGNSERRLEFALSEARERLAASRFAKALIMEAPVAGVVSALQFRTGESVRGGDILCAIAPDEGLLGVLHLSNSSAALVDEGRPVQLVFDAFPPAAYGSLTGVIRSIAGVPIAPESLEGPLDAEQPMYVARVHLVDSEFGEVPRFRLLPGMQFTAHIALERRTLAEWLLEPVLDVVRTSGET